MLNFLMKNIRGKKSQLAYISRTVYSCPTCYRFVLIYTSEDHAVPHNHRVISFFFHWLFPLNQSFSLSIELQDTAFPDLDVWPIFFLWMKLAVQAPQPLCGTDPFLSLLACCWNLYTSCSDSFVFCSIIKVFLIVEPRIETLCNIIWNASV